MTSDSVSGTTQLEIRVAFLWPFVQKTLRNDPKQHEGRMPEAECNQQLPTCAHSIDARVKHAL
jgi:hypothetical protein